MGLLKWCLLPLILAGCAPVISQQSLDLVERRVPFAVLRQEPEQYTGRYFLLGGSIVAVRNTKQGGELEILQLSTEDTGEISDHPTSTGRFIARDGFLDPAIYRPGLLVTVVGEVQGHKVMPLDEIQYSYPVLSIREIHLWPPEERYAPPRFHFGFGFGTIIH